MSKSWWFGHGGVGEELAAQQPSVRELQEARAQGWQQPRRGLRVYALTADCAMMNRRLDVLP